MFEKAQENPRTLIDVHRRSWRSPVPSQHTRSALSRIFALNCLIQRKFAPGRWRATMDPPCQQPLRAARRYWKITAISVFSLSVAMALGSCLSVSNTILLMPPAAIAADRLVMIYSGRRAKRSRRSHTWTTNTFANATTSSLISPPRPIRFRSTTASIQRTRNQGRRTAGIRRIISPSWNPPVSGPLPRARRR